MTLQGWQIAAAPVVVQVQVPFRVSHTSPAQLASEVHAAPHSSVTGSHLPLVQSASVVHPEQFVAWPTVVHVQRMVRGLKMSLPLPQSSSVRQPASHLSVVVLQFPLAHWGLVAAGEHVLHRS